MRTDATLYIKTNLSMIEVLQRYGFELDRKGTCLCPFHGEKTPSFKAYDGNRGFYCFGCGESGDVISFVQKYFNLSFAETLRKIDTDFHFGLFGNVNRREAEKSAKQAFLQRKEAKKKEAIKNNVDKAYWEGFDEWKRLSENKQKFAPKTPDAPLHPLFLEAVQKIAHQEYMLDCAEKKRRKYDY